MNRRTVLGSLAASLAIHPAQGQHGNGVPLPDAVRLCVHGPDEGARVACIEESADAAGGVPH
ncbi:MAG: hypothetical protein JNL62_12740 [Bryobacterales bacterium]|nr:hypothetical protein [Bryobacterales bacterium]